MLNIRVFQIDSFSATLLKAIESIPGIGIKAPNLHTIRMRIVKTMRLTKSLPDFLENSAPYTIIIFHLLFRLNP